MTNVDSSDQIDEDCYYLRATVAEDVVVFLHADFRKSQQILKQWGHVFLFIISARYKHITDSKVINKCEQQDLEISQNLKEWVGFII